jgi:glutamine synthetase
MSLQMRLMITVYRLLQAFFGRAAFPCRGMSLVLNPLETPINDSESIRAPIYITWARVNRSALIRVPRITTSATETTRLEIRNPDPAVIHI